MQSLDISEADQLDETERQPNASPELFCRRQIKESERSAADENTNLIFGGVEGTFRALGAIYRIMPTSSSCDSSCEPRMRGDVVYRVYALHEGREKDSYFGAFRSVADAEAEVERLRTREMNGANWAAQYHNKGFVIREFVVETNFSIPPLPKPRDKYAVRGTRKPNQPGTIDSTIVEVLRRGKSGVSPEKLCEYERNLFLTQTFEPFRQGDKDFALISRDYMRTAVLDLTSGRVIAEEPDAGGAHFCPVGFYVPDWWVCLGPRAEPQT